MKELVLLLPELFLVLTLAGLVASEIGYHGERTRLVSATALIGLGGALVQTLLTYQYGASQVFRHALSIDGLSLFFKLFFIVLAALTVIISIRSREIAQDRQTEYCTLIISSVLAMCLAASASDILVAFLALQFMNVLAYFLAAYGRGSVLSTEAAVKYMIFGSVSGSLLLYGLAILFSSTHAINMYDMHRALIASPFSQPIGLVTFMLVFLALCFQVSAFPMYLWAPDVLEGAPTAVSAFLSLGPRAAGFAVAIRFLLVVFAQPTLTPGQWQVLNGLDWTRIVGLISGMTMMIGALLALRQEGAKRMVAYIVMAETGFLLLGVLVLDEVGLSALLYNFIVELFALMGVFCVLSFLFDELQSDRLSDLRGTLSRAVPESIFLIAFLACLVGMPPLPGFIGKFTLIGAAIRHQWNVLAVVAIASIALCSIAVARLAYSLIGDFRKPADSSIDPDLARRAILVAILIPMVLVGVFADSVLGWAGQSLRFILW